MKQELRVPKEEQIQKLLFQALETEMGGVQVYEKAIQCASNQDLKEEWQEYLKQTKNHEQILSDLFPAFGIKTSTQTIGRRAIKEIGEGLLRAMTVALESGNAEHAQLVAAECVVLAETKDHLNWELLGMVAKKLSDQRAKALKEACKKVEDEEDEHLYHTTGWTRELWIQGLGLEAILPPPEEKKDTKTGTEGAKIQKKRIKAAAD